jgi:hypothetical protein
MNIYYEEKRQTQEKILKKASFSRFIGNSILGGFLATGIYTGLKPQEHFNSGFAASIALAAALFAEKHITDRNVNELLNKYEKTTHYSTELKRYIPKNSIADSENSASNENMPANPRIFTVDGIKESVPYSLVLGGISEAGAFIFTNRETTNTATSLIVGSLALAGGAILNYALNKVVEEDITDRSINTLREIDSFYSA